MLKFKSTCQNPVMMIIFLSFFLTPAYAQFTADMIQTEDGETSTIKLYVEDPFYCFEQEEEGEHIFVIVNQEEKVTRVLRPSIKMYIEMEISSTPKPTDHCIIPSNITIMQGAATSGVLA